MTIITPAILAELRWLAASKLALAVIDKAVLAELIAIWEAAHTCDNYFQQVHDSDKGHAERSRGWDRDHDPST